MDRSPELHRSFGYALGAASRNESVMAVADHPSGDRTMLINGVTET